MELLYLPSAHGGVGSVCFASDADQLYSLTTASLQGRPSDADGEHVTRLSIKAIRRDMESAKAEMSTDKDVRLGRYRDDSIPWFDIQHVTVSTTISDDAFQLGMANTTCATLPPQSQYRSCGGEPGFDHSQACHRCGGPYRYPRHQRIQHEFISTATAHGIITTANFFGLGAKPKEKRPDVIVFRGSQKKIPVVLDFVCTHQAPGSLFSAMDKFDKVKINKYAGYLAPEGSPDVVEVYPFVVSSKALISLKTQKRIQEIAQLATRKGFAYELIRRVKAAVINFEPFRKQALAMRHANGTLIVTVQPLPHSDPDTAEEQSDDVTDVN